MALHCKHHAIAVELHFNRVYVKYFFSILSVPAGCGLNDSPVGLAAYILEKFSSWTDLQNRDLEDGGLER